MTPTDIPGGPPGSAPIVGCDDAERPARRDPEATAVCEAVDGGRCWYVSPEGDDSHAGDFGSPFGTPQAAVRLAGPGDVIYLRGGVYTDANAHDVQPVSWSDPSRGTRRGFISIRSVLLPDWAGGENYSVAVGEPEAPITIRSLPGERACASGVGDILIGSGGQAQEVSFWTVEGITLHQGAVIVEGGRKTTTGYPTDRSTTS